MKRSKISSIVLALAMLLHCISFVRLPIFAVGDERILADTTSAEVISSSNNDYIVQKALYYYNKLVPRIDDKDDSFANIYFHNLRNSIGFIASVNTWEALHIASNPSYSLESGMVTKKDIFTVLLFDLFALFCHECYRMSKDIR